MNPFVVEGALAMLPPDHHLLGRARAARGPLPRLGNRAEAERQAQQAWAEVPERDRPGLGDRLRAARLLPGA